MRETNGAPADDDDAPVGRPRWRFRALLGLNLAALALLLTWGTPPLSGIWARFDYAAFRLLNGSLAWGETYQTFWALMNHRRADTFGFFLFSGLLLLHCLDNRRYFAWRIASVLLFAIVMFGSRYTAKRIIGKSLEYRRDSPTRVYDDALRLSQLVPGIKAKESSGRSFPGDHGTICLMFLAYMALYARRRFIPWALLLAVLFSLPRLISGAHWASDLLVGSAVIALAGTSALYATPLHDAMARRLAPWISRMTEWLPWIPEQLFPESVFPERSA